MQMAEITFMGPRSKGITICDVADRTTEVMHPDAQPDGAMEADLDFARQLQAKLDAEEARGGASNRSAHLLQRRWSSKKIPWAVADWALVRCGAKSHHSS